MAIGGRAKKVDALPMSLPRWLTASFGPLGPVCRLGLSTRGSGALGVDDVLAALERGVNFLNWCGTPDGLSTTVVELGPRRPSAVVCVQFEARTAGDATRELERILTTLRTDYVDILTFYYVEEQAEWEQIIGP